MKKEAKLLLFTIICFSVAILLIIYRYEGLLKAAAKQVPFTSVPGDAAKSKTITTSYIEELIRKSKEYIGDSITVFENGSIKSSNGKLQGTIEAVINSKNNMDIVVANMNTNQLPVEYNIYELAATYYRRQYADEFKSR